MSTLDELLYYCQEGNSYGALMLTGQWGCGKTYRIEPTTPISRTRRYSKTTSECSCLKNRSHNKRKSE